MFPEEKFSINDFKKDIVYEDSHRGYDFFVKDFPSHYCAYVRIPEGHPYHKIHYKDEKMNISVHGKLSFSEMLEDEYWIGWDYGHGGDEKRNFELIDIIKDCSSVIMQLFLVQK